VNNIVRIKRKPRPLQKTYQPDAPYWMERLDQEDGSITYEVMDARPGSYRIVCWTNDDMGGNPYAKHDAEQIVRSLNLLVQYGMEALPKVCETDRW
jgi:hypothetical protein